jgi:hypothetical protein
MGRGAFSVEGCVGKEVGPSSPTRERARVQIGKKGEPNIILPTLLHPVWRRLFTSVQQYILIYNSRVRAKSLTGSGRDRS